MKDISVAVEQMNIVVIQLKERSKEIQETIEHMTMNVEKSNFTAVGIAMEVAKSSNGENDSSLITEIIRMAEESERHVLRVTTRLEDLNNDTEQANAIVESIVGQVNNQVELENLFKKMLIEIDGISKDITVSLEIVRGIIDQVKVLKESIYSITNTKDDCTPNSLKDDQIAHFINDEHHVDILKVNEKLKELELIIKSE